MNTHALVVALALATAVAELAVADDHATDLRRCVAVGDGMFSGFASGGLARSAQKRSAPALIARQAGGRLLSRLVDARGLPPPFEVSDADRDGRLDAGELVRRRGGPRGRGNAGGAARNLAVPGEDLASIFDGVTARNLLPALSGGSAVAMRDAVKPFLLGADASTEPVSQLSRARALDPSFVLVWLGNSDALRLVPASGETRAALSVEEFGQRFRRVLDVLAESGADMAVANLPDPSAFPVLRRAGGEVTTCRGADGTLHPVASEALVSLAADDRAAPPPCGAVLSPEARRQASATVRAYNAEIAAAIDALEARSGLRVARVDMHALFEDAATRGLDVDGDGAADLSADFLGGLFGLDGIHPTRTGQAVLANAFIAAINDRFATALPPLDVARTMRGDPLVGSPYRPVGPAELGVLAGAHTSIFPRRLAARLAARLRAGLPPDAGDAIPFAPAVVGVPTSYFMFSGLETGDNGEFDVNRNCNVVTAPVCTGNRACQKGVDDNPSTLVTRPMNVPEAYVRTYHRVAVGANPSPTEACAPIVGFDTNVVVAVCSADVCVQPDGRLRYRLRDRINGVTVGSPSAVLDAATWRRIEVRSLLRAGVNDDECELRLDGATVASAANLNLGTGVLESAFATNRQGAFTQPPAPGSWTATFDDVAVTQGQWPGPGRVLARQGRAGVPTYDQFTPIGAAVEVAWSETPPGSGLRAESPDAGDPLAQTMFVNPLDAGLNRVTTGAQLAVCQSLLHAGTSGPPDRQYALRRRVAGVNVDTPLTGINGAAQLFGDGLLGGFWVDSLANVNASQVGAVKSGGAGGQRLVVNDAWLSCEYQPPVGEAACQQVSTVDCVPTWGATAVGAVSGFANFADGASCTTGNATAYTVQSCSIAVGAAAPGSSIRCAIYNNTPDPNRDALCASAPTPAVANSVNTLAVTGCPMLAPNTPYWIVWNNNDAGMQYRTSDVGCNGPSGSTRYAAAAFPTGTWTPDPWGTTVADTCRVITYMSLVPFLGTTTSSTSTTSTSTTSTTSTSVTSTTSSTVTTSTIPTTTSSSVTSTTSSSTTSTTASGLVAAYSFNVAGATVADASGNGNVGTVTGAVWTAAGRNGGALQFNGVSDWVTVADSASLDVTRITLEAWVFPTVAPVGWRTIVAKEQTGALTYFLHASNNLNRPFTGVTTAGVERVLAGTATLPVNTWSHLAATYDGAVQRLYVNGTQVATRNQTGNIDISTGALRLGGNGLYGEFFQGRIDDVRVYNRALGAAEITADMNAGITP